MAKKPPRASKLAREYNLSGAEEQQIQEAFSLFSIHDGKKARKKNSSLKQRNNHTFDDDDFDNQESTPMIPVSDLRPILVALSLSIPDKTSPEYDNYVDLLRPSQELGFLDYETFLAICSVLMKDRSGKKRRPNNIDHQREVDEAWALFINQTPVSLNSHINHKNCGSSSNINKSMAHTKASSLHRNNRKFDENGEEDGDGNEEDEDSDNDNDNDELKDQGKGNEDRISMATLRAVAKTLKEDVSDDLLRDMILEANNGAGITTGVGKYDFEMVMRRAGVWR